MTPREMFASFVDEVGGRSAAARLLGCSYAAVDHAYTGRRPLSADMAIEVQRISRGQYQATQLRPEVSDAA